MKAMFSNMKAIFTILITSVLLGSQANAQDNLAPAEMDLVEYSDFPSMHHVDDLGFKIMVTSLFNEAIYIRHNKDYKRLQPTREALSQTHYYDGVSPMVFYRKGMDADGQETFVACGEASFSSGTKDVILALRKKGQKYTGVTIDMSLKGQPLSSVRFINFTPANLVVLLNDQQANLMPGEDLITQFKSEEKQYFKFKIGAMYEDEAKLIFSNRYPFRGQMRQLFIGYAIGNVTGSDVPFRVISHRDRGPEPRPVALLK